MKETWFAFQTMTLQFSMFLILLRRVFGVDGTIWWDGSIWKGQRGLYWTQRQNVHYRWEWKWLAVATTNADPHELWEEHVNQPIVKFNFSQASSSGTSKKTNMHRDTQTLWTSSVKGPKTRWWSLKELKFIPAKSLPLKLKVLSNDNPHISALK